MIIPEEGTPPTTLITKLHIYSFRKDEEEGAKAWKALKERLYPTNHLHSSWGSPQRDATRCKLPMGGVEQIDEQHGIVTLDCSHVFDDQWNTPGDNGWRIFDWYERYIPQTPDCQVRSGHYLDITSEMVRFRQQVWACGYCGYQGFFESAKLPKDHSGFCSKCLTNPYLEEKDYLLLRLQPVYRKPGKRQKWKELTPEEVALINSMVEAAFRKSPADTEYLEKRYQKIQDKVDEAQKDIENALEVAECWRWLQARPHIPLEHMIFYKHTGVFTFGWQGDRGMLPVAREVIEEHMEGFPGKWEFAGPKRK